MRDATEMTFEPGTQLFWDAGRPDVDVELARFARQIEAGAHASGWTVARLAVAWIRSWWKDR